MEAEPRRAGKNDDSSSDEKKQSAQTKLRVIKERFDRRPDDDFYGGDRQLDHGFKPSSSSILQKPFADLCFCEKTQEYLVLDRGAQVQRFSMQGKQLRPPFPLEASMSFGRMFWCGAAGQCLVGYEPDDEMVWLLSCSCESLQPAVKIDFRVKAVHYDAASNQLVVVGTDQSIKYSLEDQDKELEPSKQMMTYSDSEFGPTWQLECSSLVPPCATSPASRLVASYLTTLYLLPLELDGDADDQEGGNALARRTNASPAAVTALQLHEPTGWILTGDQQGHVMAHNLSLECVMRQEGAHEARVTRLSPHPSICGFLSVAGDKLQVWSCNFRDKLESFADLGGTILALAADRSAAAVVVLATRKLSYLTMHQLYRFFAPLTSGATFIDSTRNPMYSTKTIVASRDNSVRLFSSDGSQLNVQILPETPLKAVSAVYSGNQDRLFTIVSESGAILVSDSGSRPMKFKCVFVSNEERITSLACHEFFDQVRNEDGSSKSPPVFYPIDVRIIAGTDDGKLIVINSVTGKHESACSAHSGSVLQLCSSSLTHRLASLGTDKCVKVWRIFADLSQPLHLFYELYFTAPIARIATMGLVLCAVDSSKNASVHRLIMYNTKQRERLEHRNSDDHSAPIVDMVTSEPLEICATSSLDGTVRIWSHENCLLTVLQTNVCAWNIAFSSVKGDIVFGAGRHLYKVPYDNYLTPYYRAKIGSSELLEGERGNIVPQDSKYNVYNNEVDRNLMLQPVVSLPLASLDASNSENPQVDLLVRKQICELIESRDEDIRKIKDYLVIPSKVADDRAFVTTQVWEEYTSDLLNSLTRAPRQVPDYTFQSIVETNSKKITTYNESGVFRMLFGYSLDNIADTEHLTEMLMNSKLPLSGFLPNSTLYKKKLPEIPKVFEKPANKELVKYKYPPDFLNESRESILNKRESIRLSQLVIVESNSGEQETT